MKLLRIAWAVLDLLKQIETQKKRRNRPRRNWEMEFLLEARRRVAEADPRAAAQKTLFLSVLRCF
jgi:hypothetical protein